MGDQNPITILWHCNKATKRIRGRILGFGGSVGTVSERWVVVQFEIRKKKE
jgi:hypothetical protein